MTQIRIFETELLITLDDDDFDIYELMDEIDEMDMESSDIINRITLVNHELNPFLVTRLTDILRTNKWMVKDWKDEERLTSFMPNLTSIEIFWKGDWQEL